MKVSRFFSLLLAVSLLPLAAWAQTATSAEIAAAPGTVVLVNGEALTVPATGVLAVEIPAGASVTSDASFSINLPSGAVVDVEAGSTVAVNSPTSIAVTSGSATIDTRAAMGTTILATSAADSMVRVRTNSGVTTASNGAGVSVSAIGTPTVIEAPTGGGQGGGDLIIPTIITEPNPDNPNDNPVGTPT